MLTCLSSGHLRATSRSALLEPGRGVAGRRDQDAVTRPQGLGVAASRADVAGGRWDQGGATGDGVDAVTLGAAERVLLELDVAVTVEDVLARALVVRAVRLLHVPGRG